NVACSRSIPSTKRLIRSLRKLRRKSYSANHITKCVFTQPGSIAVFSLCPTWVSLSPDNGLPADIVRVPFGANFRRPSLKELMQGLQKGPFRVTSQDAGCN